jgi:hypothetical protein
MTVEGKSRRYYPRVPIETSNHHVHTYLLVMVPVLVPIQVKMPRKTSGMTKVKIAMVLSIHTMIGL